MQNFPYAWLFFVPFIVIATYTAINIFMANIVNEMQQIQAEMLKQEGTEIDQLRDQLQRMEVMLLKLLAKQEEDELLAMKQVQQLHHPPLQCKALFIITFSLQQRAPR